MTKTFERRVDLQNGIYKMGWPNPTYPQNQVDIHFILRTTPTRFVEETGGGIILHFPIFLKKKLRRNLM